MPCASDRNRRIASLTTRGRLCSASSVPQLRVAAGTAQLIVRAKPFLIRGGGLGNPSAGTAEAAAAVLPAPARRNVDTVLMPVAWDQIEPHPGRFEFATLDHWIALARICHLDLVLWFGSSKNAFLSYAPRWVLDDPRRYTRAPSAPGTALPESLRERIELFRNDGWLMRDENELFSVQSGFHVLICQAKTSGYDPFADHLGPNPQAALDEIQEVVASCASTMPSHEAFIQRHCRAASE